MSFFKELKRRNVFKVGIAYIIIAWVLMQVGETLGPALFLPNWINSALAFFLLLGFPLALFFAWAFEMTPEGVKKQKDVDRSESITSQTGRKLDYTIIGLLAVALIYFVWEARFENEPPSEAVAQTKSVTEAETVVAAITNEPEQAVTKQSIAVLPFDNRSALEEDKFFVDGIHDDLLSTIAKIGSLKVISRTSVMEYRGTNKKIPVIAKELGVANILEGGIQRSGNQVRINVQLIDAVTDEHLWAEIFDRELTAENLFAIQSEISQNIANALKTVLSLEEKTRINTMPTDNLQAYDSYLRGRQLMATREAVKLEQAVEEFNKAVELDPQFALAWVGVADSNALLTQYGTLATKLALPIRENAIKQALAIDDKLGEAYASLGLLETNRNQHEKAENAFKRAIELSPNYATAYHWYSNYVSRSSMLRGAEATKLAEKAFELDPRSSVISVNLALQYRLQGLLALAERQYLDLIALDPEFAYAYVALAGLYLEALGKFDKALALYRKAFQLDPGNPVNLLSQLYVYQQLGDIKAMEGIRSAIAAATGEDFMLVGWADVWIGVAQHNEAGTSETLERLLPKIDKNQSLKEGVGVVELLFGDEERARELFLAATPGWLDPMQWERLIQDDSRYPCMVSWILMNTGDKELGADLLRQATIFLDETLPAAQRHADAWNPEVCYLASGDTEKALDAIEIALDHGHLYWQDLFFRMPMYDQIRTEPRFQAVIEERERRIATQREAVAKMDAVSPP